MKLSIVKKIRDNDLNISVAISYVNLFLSVITSIIITPVIVKTLGNSEYGLYMLVYSVAMYLNLEGFGIGAVVVRYVKTHLMLDQKDKLENFLYLSLIIFLILAAVAVLIFAGINLGAETLFKNTIEHGNIERFKSMLSLMTLNCVMMFLVNYLVSVITGYQRFLLIRFATFFRIIFRTLFIIINIKSVRIEAFIVLEVCVTAAVLAVYTVYAFTGLKIRIRPHFLDKSEFILMFKRTSFIFLSLITDNICWNSGNIVVAMTLGTASTGIYSVAMTLTGVFSQLSTTITGLFLPGITELVVANASKKKLLDKMSASGRYLIMLLSLVIFGFAFIGTDFLEIYLGADFRASYYIALPLMLSLLYPAIQFIGESIIQAYNRYNFRSAMYMAASVVSVGLNFWLIPRLDIRFSWIGLSIPVIIFRVFAMNLYYRHLGLDMLEFFKRTMPKMLLTSAFIIPILLICFKFFDINFIFKGILVTAVYCTGVYGIYMNKHEKYALVNLLARKSK